MPQSLKARLGDDAQAVVDYTRTWGAEKAMQKWEIRSYMSFTKFLEEETGNPHFGDKPLVDPTFKGSWAQDLLDAFLKKIQYVEAELESLRTENSQLRANLNYLRAQIAERIEPKVAKIRAACLINEPTAPTICPPHHWNLDASGKGKCSKCGAESVFKNRLPEFKVPH